MASTNLLYKPNLTKNNMAQVKFYRGLAAKYNSTTHANGVFFATDTKEIWMNGISYGNIANLSITDLDSATSAKSLEYGKSYEIKAANGTDTVKFTIPALTATSKTGTYITVSLSNGALDLDETALATALDAWKGKTTLSAGTNKDLTAGDVVISLGGDAASADTKTVTLSKITLPATKADQKLSGATETASFGGTQTITLSGVTDTQSSTATITIPSFTANAATDDVVVSIASDGKISVDSTVVDGKISDAADAYKGETTLAAGTNTDLTAGDVEITLGGDGAAANQKVTISKINAKADQVLSNPTETATYGGTQTVTLSGVSGDGSTSVVNLPAAQTISTDGTAAFGASNQTITISDAVSSNSVSIAIPALSATEGNSDYVTVGLTNGAISVSDTIADTFLKTADANNEVISISDVTLTKAATGTTYSGSMSYTDNSGDSKTATISFDSADFIKDAFLDSVTVGTGDDAGYLIFTWNTDAKKDVTKIKIADFIKAYTAGDGIDITNNVVKAVAKTGDYVKVDTDGIQLDSNKLQGATDTTKFTDTDIALASYVDEQISTAKTADAITVANAKGSSISAFGGEASMEISQGGVSKGSISVKVPSFTAGSSTSTNVGVSIATDGVITVTSTEQAATDKTTYGGTALTQKGYVDEKAAAAEANAKAAVTGGTNTANFITVTTAATTAAPTVSATLTSSTATATAIATDKYVDESVANALIWNEVA